MLLLLNAACATPVIESHSSSITNLRLSPTNYLVSQKVLMVSRTTSIPLSSEAFSSRVLCLNESPITSLARASMHVVLPVPAGPWNIRCGIFFSAMNFFTVEVFTCEDYLGMGNDFIEFDWPIFFAERECTLHNISHWLHLNKQKTRF